MKNTLKNLFISFLYLPALGSVGCTGHTKAELGFLQTENQNTSELTEPKLSIEENNQLHQKFSKTEAFVDAAGGIGCIAMGFTRGIVGGGAGALGGGLYAACTSAPLCENIAHGASIGAHCLSSIGAPVGRYAFSGVARGLIWVTPYVISSAEWAAYNSYNFIKCAAYQLSNPLSGTPDGSNDAGSTMSDLSYVVDDQTCQGWVVIESSAQQIGNAHDTESTFDSGSPMDSDDEEEHFDADDH